MKLRAKSSSLLPKPSNGVENGETSNGSSNHHDEPRKCTAWTEYKIISICEFMMDIVTASRRHTEKQQARTVEEKEAEIAEEEFGLLPEDEEEKVDDDDEEPLFNPLNIPLGWDGKPIPYWLYKLHGLGVEYKCEICGNQSYWGRRAFDKHFQEWRHAHGMRCLAVPNTKHFHDITRISDVLELYKKIGQKVGGETFVGAVEEEFEDTEGNLLNRRTYEDLARQGLL
jgi:splicing factor 3A subunit 3